MSIKIYGIPIQTGTPQTFAIALDGLTYQLTFRFRAVTFSGKVSISTSAGFTADSIVITADSIITVDSISGSVPSVGDLSSSDGAWVLDIADTNGNDIITGIPLVTGANLLAQYEYLGFTGGLWVQTTSDPDAVPTFENFGDDGRLYWVVETT